MPWHGVARIRELGTPGYWQRRQLRSVRTQRWTRLTMRVGAWSSGSGASVKSAWRLLVRSLWSIAAAVVTVTMLEAVAALFRLTDWGADSPLLTSPKAGLEDAVSSLLGAAVAIAATLLGLYYTTVGVIASTIYKSVPGDVRDLFISERNGEVYLKVVVQTIAVGVLILVAAAFGYDVVGLTLLVEGALAALTCIGLVVVTRHLFDYFDPSKLSAPLLKSIVDDVRVVTRPKTRGVAQRQQSAHYGAYRALASFRHLAEMLDGAELRNATAPVNLTRQLLGILRFYSGWKYAIPTDSNWWDRVPKHQNWLTIDHSRLELALNTSVTFPAEMEPDYLWVENAVARLLGTTLSVSFRSQAGANALAVSEEVAQLVFELTARLQIKEALAIESAWDNVAQSVATTDTVAAPNADDYEIHLNQMAAAESLIRPITTMLLGLERAAQLILTRDLPAEFAAAIEDPDELYRGTLPTGTRQMLENFATAIRREVAIEKRRVTPPWWVNHLAARSMAEALLAAEAGVLGEVRARTIDQVERFRDAKRYDLAAIAGMSALELLHKIEFHLPTIRAAEAKLASYRNPNTSIEFWPERSVTTSFEPVGAHMELLKTLSELLPLLRTAEFDPREPDLYGQLYQFTVDGAFRAILDGDTARGLAMYRAALMEMDTARLRIVKDLKRHDPTLLTTYAVEPVITAMDLAGYALLMNELDGTGIWPEVKAMWDGLLDGNPNLAEFLRTVASFADRPVGLTVGGLERSRRSIVLRQLLETRGIEQEDVIWTEDGRFVDPPAPHASPIVSALAPDTYAMNDDLYALFLVEYLRNHLPADADLGFQARSLAESIERIRAATDSTASEGEDVDA